MSFLTEVKGWTPVIDALTKEFSLTTSAVYGVVWRYCQGEDRICRASLETIGEHIGVDKATVMRHIKKLCDAGYLVDLTPELRNVPHIYADAGRAKIINLIEAQTVAQCNTSKRKKHQTVAQDNVTVAECNKSVAQSQLKKEEKESKKEGARPKQIQLAPIPAALADLCRIRPELMTNGLAHEVQESTNLLQQAGITPDLIRAFGEWWYKNDWRGRKGEAPKPRQVCETWMQFEDTKSGNDHGQGRGFTAEQLEAIRLREQESEQERRGRR